jgi:hypothetical protein
MSPTVKRSIRLQFPEAAPSLCFSGCPQFCEDAFRALGLACCDFGQSVARKQVWVSEIVRGDCNIVQRAADRCFFDVSILSLWIWGACHENH